MTRFIIYFAVAISSVACSAFKASDDILPNVVVGTAVSSQGTEWMRDWCHKKGETTKESEGNGTSECLQIGGMFSVLHIENGISFSEGRKIANFDVLIAAGISTVHPRGMIFVLEPPPANVVKATGVSILAKDFFFFSQPECPAVQPLPFPDECLARLREKYLSKH